MSVAVQMVLWVFKMIGSERRRKEDARLGSPSIPVGLHPSLYTGGAGLGEGAERQGLTCVSWL